jgi:hypothetical protein
MFVIKNEITHQFYAGTDDFGNSQTTDSRHYASHFSTWDAAAKELRSMVGNWKIIPKEEA